MIFKIALYEFIIFVCVGFIVIRERKRQERLDVMMNEWLKKNVGKSRYKLRVL